MFLPSNAVRLARKQPRRPDFLLEPLQSQRPLGYDTFWEGVDCVVLGPQSTWYLPPEPGGPLSFLLLRSVPRSEQLLPSLCSGLRR